MRFSYVLLSLIAMFPSPAAQPATLEILVRLTEQRFDAMIRADRASLEAIIAENCIFAYADGRIRSKQQHIRELAPIRMTVSLHDVNLREFGDTALLSYRVDGLIHDSPSTPSRSTSYHEMDVFHRHPSDVGRWQLVAVQGALNRSESEPARIPREKLAIWCGTYRSGGGEFLRVWMDGEHLFGRRDGAAAHEYLPRSENVFFTRDSGASYIFSRGEKGEVESLSILLPDSGTLFMYKRQPRS